MRTDLPQREQRSRSERSSKPQWGHVRVGASVIVGGIGLTSVDIALVRVNLRRRGTLRRRHAARGPTARARAPGLRAGLPQHLLGPRRATASEAWGSPGAYGHGCARAASTAPASDATSSARSSCARRCGRCAWPTTTRPRRRRRSPSSTGIARARRAGGRADAEPEHGRPRARGRRPRRGVRPGPGDRLRRARRRQLRAAESVPARALRLGLLRRLAQPLGTVVLDAHLRQPHQGRGASRRRRARPASLRRRAGNRRRVGGLPSHRVHDRLPDAPATLSHDAMAARLHELARQRRHPRPRRSPAPPRAPPGRPQRRRRARRCTSPSLRPARARAPRRRAAARARRRSSPGAARRRRQAVIGGFSVRAVRRWADPDPRRAGRGSRSTRPGTASAPASTSTAAPVARRDALAATRRGPPAGGAAPGRATARRSRRGRRGVLRRRAAVRLRYHGGAIRAPCLASPATGSSRWPATAARTPRPV